MSSKTKIEGTLIAGGVYIGPKGPFVYLGVVDSLLCVDDVTSDPRRGLLARFENYLWRVLSARGPVSAFGQHFTLRLNATGKPNPEEALQALWRDPIDRAMCEFREEVIAYDLLYIYEVPIDFVERLRQRTYEYVLEMLNKRNSSILCREIGAEMLRWQNVQHVVVNSFMLNMRVPGNGMEKTEEYKSLLKLVME